MPTVGPSYPRTEVFPLNMGEESTFRRVFTLYHAPLRDYCDLLTHTGDACQDIVSQLFITLWTKKVEFESAEHMRAYLYRSAKNACLNYIRNDKKVVEKKELLGQETTEISDDYLDAVIKTEVWAELYRAIEGLPSQCCKVITLNYLEGMSNQEIADEMNLSLQTVKNYKIRGLGQLKDKLPDSFLVVLLSAYLFK